MSEKGSHRVSVGPMEHSSSGLPYLLGLRGLYTIQAFLFLYFQAFIPSIFSANSPVDPPSSVRVIVERTFGLFFHPTLIASSFILLSARTSCVPFLFTPTSGQLAFSLFHRSTRLVVPLAVALVITSIVNNFSDVIPEIQEFKRNSRNEYLPLPYKLSSPLAIFNAIFGFFWNVRDYEIQAGNIAFYSASIWPISVIYTQSFTVYMTMVCIPFTRSAWRIQAFLFFILTAWWVQSWAWYSITGLLLADAAAQGAFHAEDGDESCIRIPILHHRGRKLNLYLPVWAPGLIVLVAGFAFRLVGTNLRPTVGSRELSVHASFGTQDDPVAQPQARDDIYILVLGFSLLAETVKWLQRLLSNQVLTSIGRRSLSIYLIAAILVNTTGIKLYLYLSQQHGLSHSVSAMVCFLLSAAQTAFLGEIFYRSCERLPGWAIQKAFNFITDA